MDDALIPRDAFSEALRLAGSQAALAAIVQKQQPAISKRLRGTGVAEPEEVLLIEQATGVSRHLLRPDIYPPEAGVPPCSAPSVAGGVPVVPYDRDVVSDKGAA